jgi:hypothetical protein
MLKARPQKIKKAVSTPLVARSKQILAPKQQLVTWPWLLLLYTAAVAIHFLALRETARFPAFATDQVQYISVAENIRLGNGFTTRGEFHTGLPPLYPLFVAFAHSIGPDLRTSALLLSTVFVCLVVFPLYGLAQLAGIERRLALLLAVAGAFVPHTMLAGMYMTETLYYPMYMTAFWLCARWILAPGTTGALASGLLLSVMLLTKVAAASLAGALLVVFVIVFIHRMRSKQPAIPFLLQGLLIFGLATVTQLLWQAYKAAHNAAGLGMYGRVLGDQGLPNLSVGHLLVYFADFLLAPGLLTSIPLLLWFLEEGRKRVGLAVLLLCTLVSQVGIHGFLEAGLNAELKERLFFYSLPLMAIFAVKGIEWLREAPPGFRVLFIAVPIMLLGLLMLNHFQYNPVLDAPWISLFGSVTANAFSQRRLFVATTFAILAIGIPLLYAPRRKAPRILSWAVAGFYSLGFANGTAESSELTRQAMAYIQPMAEFIARNVKVGGRLISCAGLAYYQESHWATPTDPFFAEWHRRLNLNEILVMQLEALLRLDIRAVQAPNQIRAVARPGDHVISTTRLSDLELVDYRWPYYMYLVKNMPSPINALYITDITADLSYGFPVGATAENWNFQMLGQPVNLPPGYFRASLYLKNVPQKPVYLEAAVAENGTLIEQKEANLNGPTTLEFAHSGTAPVRFRLSGPGIASAVHQDLVVEFARSLDQQ